jgi:hypothetical protein
MARRDAADHAGELRLATVDEDLHTGACRTAAALEVGGMMTAMLTRPSRISRSTSAEELV